MKTGLNINSKQTIELPRLFLTMFVDASYKNESINYHPAVLLTILLRSNWAESLLLTSTDSHVIVSRHLIHGFDIWGLP